jgi:signal transduction histidine kinase
MSNLSQSPEPELQPNLADSGRSVTVEQPSLRRRRNVSLLHSIGLRLFLSVLGGSLGLAISYQIVVKKHHGVLKCNSELGQGAEFWIEIPIRQCAQQKTSAPEDRGEPREN